MKEKRRDEKFKIVRGSLRQTLQRTQWSTCRHPKLLLINFSMVSIRKGIMLHYIEMLRTIGFKDN